MITEENMKWYQKMLDAYNTLSNDEKQELAEWEKQNLVNSNLSTSDWPGWITRIGMPPWKLRAN